MRARESGTKRECETQYVRTGKGDRWHKTGCKYARDPHPWRWAEGRGEDELRAITWLSPCKRCLPHLHERKLTKRTCPRCWGPKDFYAEICRACLLSDRGETYVTSHGYERRYGDHMYVHRVVAEETIGRPLRAGEHVHHINGDRLDNRPENLEVLPSREHHQLHMVKRVTDTEIRKLLLVGYTTSDLANRGIWQQRATAIKKGLVQEGFGPALKRYTAVGRTAK